VNVFLYLLVPALIVGAFALATWVRNRQPTSLEAGLDSFRREMQALSPEAAPTFRHREEPDRPSGSRPGAAPRRPGPPRPPRPPSASEG
jgi:hypothetical protein